MVVSTWSFIIKISSIPVIGEANTGFQKNSLAVLPSFVVPKSGFGASSKRPIWAEIFLEHPFCVQPLQVNQPSSWTIFLCTTYQKLAEGTQNI
ncbi:hypothetical protein TNCT_565901 [Trichonephila clavata]|uniref:Uncharacterized protein n=1 Tax=Trichonephila clavata TaxID=2740835 RepID=A0A8X6LF62_TRICU|nr:hypothetical protein TNCT_565901 [Trichonephila clavata]